MDNIHNDIYFFSKLFLYNYFIFYMYLTIYNYRNDIILHIINHKKNYILFSIHDYVFCRFHVICIDVNGP